MKPFTTTCKPREDVLQGDLPDNQFAAQLDAVVRHADTYAVYGDPDDFFAITFPTDGLRKLLRRVFGRLTGGVPDADAGVIRVEEAFGGGKTHSLIALHHLATGGKPANIDEFVDPKLIPDGCRSVALVGDHLSATKGRQAPDGTHALTLWGDLAVQLGEQAWAELKADDQSRTTPDIETLHRAFGGAPLIIMIDEIAHYLRTVGASGDPDIRRMAKQVPSFLKTLFEMAMSRGNVVVVMTLATAQDAFADETATIKAEVDSVVGRQHSSVKPAEDVEIAQIINRRLFETIDPAATQAAADAYTKLYEQQASRDEPLGMATDHTSEYATQIAKAYPFHPELIRVLDERLSVIPQFQRTRSALRLLARTVRTLHDAGSTATVINVADLPLSDADLRGQLTDKIERPEFDQVARADIVGADAHATQVDTKHNSDRAGRAATVAFIHSLERRAQVGATRADLLLGALRPSDDADTLVSALDDVAEIGWHVEYDGARYKFSPEPNFRKIIATDIKALIGPHGTGGTKVLDYITDTVNSLFKKPQDPDAAACVKVDVFPSGGLRSVKDDAALHVVVVPQGDLTVTEQDAVPPPSVLVEALDNYGDQFRKHRNGLVFVVADQHQIGKMAEQVARKIAAQQLVDSDDRMAQLGSDKMRDNVRAYNDEQALHTTIAVASCFSHVYWPAKDKANGNLQHGMLTPAQKGDVSKPATDRAWELLNQSGKIQTGPIPPSYLVQKSWPSGKPQVSTRELSEFCWRDPGARIIPNTATIHTAIGTGAANEEFVYYDIAANAHRYGTKGNAAVRIADDTVIATEDHAIEQGWLVDPLTDTEVLDTVQQSAGNFDDLRTTLEKARGHDVDRADIRRKVASLIRQGKVEAHLGSTDGESVSASKLDDYAYDKIFVTPAAAGATKTQLTAFTAQGTVGTALTNALAVAVERIGEHDTATGIASITIRIDSDAAGARLKSAMVLPTMAQKLSMTVELDFAADYDGHGEASARLRFTKSNLQKIKPVIERMLTAATTVSTSSSAEFTCTFDEPVLVDDQAMADLREAFTTAFPDVTCKINGKVA